MLKKYIIRVGFSFVSADNKVKVGGDIVELPVDIAKLHMHKLEEFDTGLLGAEIDPKGKAKVMYEQADALDEQSRALYHQADMLREQARSLFDGVDDRPQPVDELAKIPEILPKPAAEPAKEADTPAAPPAPADDPAKQPDAPAKTGK
jgi:hypothetical protein